MQKVSQSISHSTPESVAMESITRWSPGNYLTDQPGTGRFALVILNQPIVDVEGFTKLWKNASLRVCADGGANHLFRFRIDGDIPIPDCITGDLDSLESKVGNSYRALGVPIVPDRSQYATDFTKALNWIAKQERRLHEFNGNIATAKDNDNDNDDDDDDDDDDDTNVDDKTTNNRGTDDYPLDVVAYSATGGRVDQVFHAIDQLFQASQNVERQSQNHNNNYNNSNNNNNNNAKISTSPSASSASPLASSSLSPSPRTNARIRRRVTLMSDESVTFLLEKGKNVIDTPLRVFGKTCGLIPVAGSSIITTAGFEWDLKETETRFGGMVSTSNHLVREMVEVETTELLLFTMEMRKAK
ncbi:hypothetical protein AA313_de0203840 [Arthrobotrys entomopaga]|nr:hypothetical protein AA313_de0203840 [Arthrobotrys entomopaga]